MTRKTKIVATIGPACDSYEGILGLVNAGVNVFRLNFSHGTHEQHATVIQHIKKIRKEQRINLAILGDLQGPKLRIGEVENNALEFRADQIITFTNEPCLGTKEKVYISYPNFHEDVKVGELILIDDGKIETTVIEITADHLVKAQVKYDSVLQSKKGINLPYTKISLPSLTEKDLKDLDFIIDQKVDWIALSFVRNPHDILTLKSILQKKESCQKVISKIEKPEAVAQLREIILASDGIMVARGDLGVEMPLEKVPMIQKDIVRMCIHRAKPVIIATQMMESMLDRTRPNRSEVTDVANAVMEGADAVMLSGETAMGNHPSLVVKTMVDIIQEVEKQALIYNRNLVPQTHSPSFLSDALCYNACQIAESVKAKAIIGMTQSGYTGFMLSSYRPFSSLYVFSRNRMLINQLSLSWGIRAFYYDQENESMDEIIEDQIGILKRNKLVEIGQVIVNTGSMPTDEHLPTNMIKISKVK